MRYAICSLGVRVSEVGALVRGVSKVKGIHTCLMFACVCVASERINVCGQVRWGLSCCRDSTGLVAVVLIRTLRCFIIIFLCSIYIVYCTKYKMHSDTRRRQSLIFSLYL